MLRILYVPTTYDHLSSIPPPYHNSITTAITIPIIPNNLTCNSYKPIQTGYNFFDLKYFDNAIIYKLFSTTRVLIMSILIFYTYTYNISNLLFLPLTSVH